MILRRRRIYSDRILFRRIQSNHKNLLTSRVSIREGDVTMEAEVGVMHGHKPKNEDNLLKLEKNRKTDSPLDPPEGNRPVHPF